MRVRIGICLLALCWPLLATAAPALAPAPAHACCRRDGAHHCGKPAPPDSAVSTICPHSGQRLKFAGSKSAPPVSLLPLQRSLVADRIIPAPFANATRNHSPILSSRAPPLA